MDPDLNELSETQLQEMIEGARRALRDRQDGRRKDVYAQIKKLAASVGANVEIIEAGDKAKPMRTGKVAAKYRNPSDHSQTWTGRGMKPVWLRDLINQGSNIEDFAIR
ncbi:MAG: H-NS histone family protein [Methylococcaceae bacterium]|nr:MAG: H-NS histone family protein [Methylococcaceae bacterium]